MKYTNRINRLHVFTENLSEGKVYRASELSRYTTSASRDLKLLVESNQLKYLGKGLYVRPKKLGKLDVPPTREELLSVFLKTNKFLVRTMSDFNKLRLGTTQLFNEVYVYNKRRDGTVMLGSRTYHFKKKNFPSEYHDEYLLVDMMNNLEKLGEDRDKVLSNLKHRWENNFELDKEVVLKFAKKYGKYWVKKLFEKLGNE